MNSTAWGASTASTYSSLETAEEHTLAAPGSSVEPLANSQIRLDTLPTVITCERTLIPITKSTKEREAAG